MRSPGNGATTNTSIRGCLGIIYFLKVPPAKLYNIITENYPGDGIVQKMYNITRKLLAEQLNISVERITTEMTFSDLDADYIDVVEMIMALEGIYDIEFPEDDLEYYPTLESLVTVLYEYLQQVKSE